ncbi:MAG: NAD-dependent epimerase/dehydratase family protein [Myxococcales bacterium FL481]|nr:MAG: NAD-dependent epimerase/dehydratase family protein [Myxococcales bacterium FL481]
MGSPMSDSKLVVVAGATGYLGGHVVEALHRQGFRVRALARRREKLREVESFCDEVFVGEATELQTLDGLFHGAFAGFSSIGIRHFRRRPTFREVDLAANLNLVEQAELAGTARFVFVSVLRGDQLRGVSPLIDAREQVVDRLHTSPMDSCILRPTGFFNDMSEYLTMSRRGTAWIIGSDATRLNPIHGADLGELTASVLQAEPMPAERNVGGPDILSQAEIVRLCAQALQREVRTRRVPGWVLRGVGAVLAPLNPNASALAKMFALLAAGDAVGEPIGKHHLRDHFAALVEANR